MSAGFTFDAGYNNPANVKTPTADSLASDGITLHRHYTFQWCAPTRAAFMTGRLPYHVLQTTNHVDRGFSMLPAKLKQVGYQTHQIGQKQNHATTMPPLCHHHATTMPPLYSPQGLAPGIKGGGRGEKWWVDHVTMRGEGIETALCCFGAAIFVTHFHDVHCLAPSRQVAPRPDEQLDDARRSVTTPPPPLLGPSPLSDSSF